ncbi:MAG: four-carbon acid sugar kinase family protein [Gemmiger sp.]|nr:four-carbon acid sugar kinase family protein [Gemmiger sp.]
MNEPKIPASALFKLPLPDAALVAQLLKAEADKNQKKIVVLDDDPTGVQTVHDVSVYTDWAPDSLRAAFAEENKLFFILTNSRGMTVEETTRAHREIAQNLHAAAQAAGREYTIVSRGDSTLRGHYPLETELLRQGVEAQNPWKVDGEIVCPFFEEGNRFTLNNVHYLRYGEELIPAAQTEFAKDKTFGYTHSNLPAYIAEKTNGAYPADGVTCIALQDLRTLALDKIEAQLMAVTGYNKVVVNAAANCDVQVFCIALYRALARGKHFNYRTAAAFVKAFGNIADRPLLARAEMLGQPGPAAGRGGIVVVGSHTAKTTAQLEALKGLAGVEFIEMNSDRVLEPGGLQDEVHALVARENALLRAGRTVVVYTKRALLTLPGDTKEDALRRSVEISGAVQALVGQLGVTPAFVVAKGGITSSDIGTKALGVRRATVLGQICPGIPVWRTGAESRFPGIPYIIFPGNVGETGTLRQAVETLMGCGPANGAER